MDTGRASEVFGASELSEASEISGAFEPSEASGTAEASAGTFAASGVSRASGHAGSAGSGETEGSENGRRDDGDGVGEARGGRRRSRVAVVSVAAAVLLVGGGGAYLAAAGGAGGRTEGRAAEGAPPPLVLDGFAAAPYGATYVARDALPAGPGSAPVYVPQGEVGKDAVARLARALGVAGTPVADGRIWRVGGKDGTGPSLTVNRDAPGSWTFSRYAPGTDNCTKGVLCAHDPMGPTGSPVSVSRATAAAAAVLKAAGLDDARIDASRLMGAQRVVDAEPVVGGLPTYGWTTGLTVGGQGEVVGGHGLLGTPVKGATYPVLSAAKTLGLMNAAPKGDHRMGIGGCTRPVPVKDRFEQPCGASAPVPRAGADAGTDPVTVDKAVFGLAAHSVAGRQTLVPSWLFSVPGNAAGGAYTVTYPAVDPAYLGSATPSGGPAPKPHGVEVEGYTADGRELTVSFYGGVCADYSAAAEESGGKVTVTVTARPWPGKVCVMMAREYAKTVRLDAPLDGRPVVGADGSRIPQGRPGAPYPGASAHPGGSALTR